MDALWWDYYPYQRMIEPSDLITGAEYTARVAHRIRRDLYRFARWGREERGNRSSLAEKLALRPIRYLDKTIANCFHLEYLDRLFPEARYIFLLRDPRATISSMLEGWHDPQKFVKPQLQRWIPASSSIRHWAYPAPPGWMHVLDRSLEQVCAWSWRQHIEIADSALQRLSPQRTLMVKYEDLLNEPTPTAQKIAQFCEVRWHTGVGRYLAERPLSRTTISRPQVDKWREKHQSEIESLMPTIAPVMEKFGYAAEV